MRVLVTGAAGYIGGRMVHKLCEADRVEQVVGTDIRQPETPHPKMIFAQQDIRNPLAPLIKQHNIDTIVHTAYVLPPIHNKSLMEDINKGGTRNVLKAASETGVRQILYTSSTTAYGFYPDNDTPLTEESPLRGNDDFIYAKNKKEIEGIFQAFTRDNPEVAVSIVRPCFVVGPGFKNPLACHLQKKIVMIPSNTLPWQFVHEDDLVEIMALLLFEKIGGIFNVAGDGTLTFKEMIQMLGNIPVPIPWKVVYPLNNLAWYLRLSFVTEIPSPSMRMMVNPWIATSEKLKQETQYQFRFDSRSAFADYARYVKTGGNGQKA